MVTQILHYDLAFMKVEGNFKSFINQIEIMQNGLLYNFKET